MKNNWRLRMPQETFDQTDSITTKILKIRGIEDKESFLNPKESDIKNPFELSNMQLAVNVIIDAIENKYKIGIYADIDADGVTSAAIMYKYLKNYGIDATILYHQRKDSHGILVNNVPKDLDLLIVVDSSSNSVNECKELYDLMNIVILDHHEVQTDNPYAVVVNPQLNDYNNKFLSGAGVVFQTCRAIDMILLNSYAEQYIDICAVGLIGDMMNVTNKETRALIYLGLTKIQESCDKNLKAILKSLKKDYKPNATTIAFYLVPFINSIIRLGKIENILAILIEEDDDNLKKLIKNSGETNNKRKEIQADALEKIEENIDLSHKIIIVDTTSMPNLSVLNGLIANNIAQKYQKPTLVASIDTDTHTLKGSGRNYGSKFDLKEVLSATNLFASVEGHAGAFGVEFEPENIDKIYEAVDVKLQGVKQEIMIDIDMVIDINDITWEALSEIMNLSFICGTGFSEPVFLVEGLSPDNIKIMKDIHIKFNASDLECVKFNVSQNEITELENALIVDMVGMLSINAWYNFGTKQAVKTKQLMIQDIEMY